MISWTYWKLGKWPVKESTPANFVAGAPESKRQPRSHANSGAALSANIRSAKTTCLPALMRFPVARTVDVILKERGLQAADNLRQYTDTEHVRAREFLV